MDDTIKILFAVGFVFLWLNPQMVGVWEAKKDVAYNAYMELQYPYDETTNQE